VSPYARTVKTASGARAVQIVYSQRRGSREIEHIGSAHTDADLELLKAVARQRLAAGKGELDLALPDSPANSGAALQTSRSFCQLMRQFAQSGHRRPRSPRGTGYGRGRSGELQRLAQWEPS